MIRRFFSSVYHWMALCGLVMKDDEPVETRDPDRQWGPASDGLMLSAKPKGQRLSVVLKNSGTEEIRANIPNWLFFYQLDISPPPPLNNFGKQALDPKRNDRRNEIILPSGKAIETELPVDSLYNLDRARYRIRVSCEMAGRRLVSNEVALE
jgi:hypothetical protein